jgi:hypothetical protein
LNEESDEYLTNYAQDLIKSYPPDEGDSDDFNVWIQQSYQLSKDAVYDGIDYEGEPSDDYLDRGYEAIRKQIAKGGYRLANELVKVYNSYTDAQKIQSEQLKFLVQ